MFERVRRGVFESGTSVLDTVMLSMEGKNEDEYLAPLDPAAAQALEYADCERVLDAAVFMDRNECETVIPAARNAAGRSMREILDVLRDAGAQFALAAREKFGSKGEW